MRVYAPGLMLHALAERLGTLDMTERMSAVATLAGAGLVLCAACGVIGRMPNLVVAPRTFLIFFTLAWVAYAGAVLVGAPLRGPATLSVILVIGLLTRLLLLGAAPSLSTDVYRYVWDARVAGAGLDPYAYAPVAPEVARLRDATIYPKLNHPTWHTVYPPLAQAFFRAVYWCAPDSILAMKLALGLIELVAMLALICLLRTLGLPPGRLAIYAWNPLLLVEILGSGHLDALVLATVTAAALASARGRDGIAAMLLGLGTLVKLYPAALLLLLPGRRRVSVWIFFGAVLMMGTFATAGIGQWPTAPIGRYVRDEYFNPGLVRSFVNEPWLALAASAVWALLVALRPRPGSLAVRAVPMVGGLIVLGANVFPWYVVWLVPFLAVAPSVPWIAFTGTVAFAYSFFLSTPWAIPLWAQLVEVTPLALGAVGMVCGTLRWRPRARARADAG